MNIMLDRLVIKRIVRMSAAADAISSGNFELGALDASGTDEVAKTPPQGRRLSLRQSSSPPR